MPLTTRFILVKSKLKDKLLLNLNKNSHKVLPLKSKVKTRTLELLKEDMVRL